MKVFQDLITKDLNGEGLTVTRVEVTQNEIVIDISTVDSDEHWMDNVKGIATGLLLDVAWLPRPKGYEKQTFVFYMKVS